METIDVLICEDEKLVALELERRLESFGYNVRALASQGENAIELARTLRPSLALMDIRLEGELNGIEVADILGRELGIPSIFLTAYCDEKTMEQAKNTRALGYLLKPVQDRDLRTAIEMGLAIHNREITVEQELECYKSFFRQPGAHGLIPFHENIRFYLSQEARREMSRELVAGVAHHLNNQLTVMRGHMEWFANAPTVGEYERRQVAIAISECDRSAQLVQRLMWASACGGYNLRPYAIQAVVNEVVDQILSRSGERIQVQAALTSEELLVGGDRKALNAALQAILKNACESIEGPGEIYLRCFTEFKEFPERSNRSARPGWYVVVQVKDSGCGIDSEILKRIFDPFYTTKLYRNAEGLGLSIALGVAESHGGWIEIQSSCDQGTTVTLYLPRVESSNSHELPLGAVKIEADKNMVLVIDDEPAIGDLMRLMLTEEGLETVVFNDPREAMRWYAEHSSEVGIVFLDLKMPHLNGAECLARMSEISPPDQLAIMTGGTLDQFSAERFRPTVRRIFSKPFGAEEVRNWVRSLVSKSRLEIKAPAINAAERYEPAPISSQDKRRDFELDPLEFGLL